MTSSRTAGRLEEDKQKGRKLEVNNRGKIGSKLPYRLQLAPL